MTRCFLICLITAVSECQVMNNQAQLNRNMFLFQPNKYDRIHE